MAKVMISMPDELLSQVDRAARERGLTRSGFLQGLARERLADGEAVRRARIERLLASPGSFDGKGTQHVREDRRAR